MGPRHRVTQHGETAVSRCAPHPLAQRLLIQPGRQRLFRHTVKICQPAPHLRLWPGTHRHVEQRRLRARNKPRHRRPATRFEIRGAAQVERIKPGKGALHLVEIRNLVAKRGGILPFERYVKRIEPRRTAQIPRQTVHHLDALQILIGQVKSGLPTGLHPVKQPDLKHLQTRDIFFELRRIEPCPAVAARIIEHDIQNARIVIVKEPETADPPRLSLDRPDQAGGILVALRLREAQQFAPVRIADKVRIERLAMTFDAVKGVEVGFKEIRAGAHFRKDHEVIKWTCHQ